jgi:hypothetical protein
MRTNSPIYTRDAQQQALSFLIRQGTYIERQVARIRYPEFQYSQLIPIETGADEWTRSITYFSLDTVGQAEWINAAGTDMPLADLLREQHETKVEMAGIGYRYNYQELNYAMRMGINLTTEKAEAARRAYEQKVERVSIHGDTSIGFAGLINNPAVSILNAAYDGTGASPSWTDKTADQILRDINDVLTGIYTGSLTVEMADTILLPIASFNILLGKRVPDTQITVMDFINRANVYTASTGRPLLIKGVRGLETAGVGSTGRMVAYRRDPDVLKMHIPMTHRFLPVWQTGPLIFDVPGIFRLGGLEIRRPASVRYLDHIVDADYE